MLVVDILKPSVFATELLASKAPEAVSVINILSSTAVISQMPFVVQLHSLIVLVVGVNVLIVTVCSNGSIKLVTESDTSQLTEVVFDVYGVKAASNA